MGNLTVLTGGYSARYEYFGAEEDFKRGLKYVQAAVVLLDEAGGHRQASCSNNFSKLYHTHFDRTGSPDSLNKAVSFGERSVNQCPIDDPTRGAQLRGVGDAYRDRFKLNGVPEDLTRSIKAYEEALASTLAPTSIRARAGISGGRLVFDTDPVKAYGMLPTNFGTIDYRLWEFCTDRRGTPHLQKFQLLSILCVATYDFLSVS